MSPTSAAGEPDPRDFYDTEEEYKLFAANPCEYVAAQIREMKLGAARHEDSLAASRKAALDAVSGKEKATATAAAAAVATGKASAAGLAVHAGRERMQTMSGSRLGGWADGVEARDFATAQKRKKGVTFRLGGEEASS